MDEGKKVERGTRKRGGGNVFGLEKKLIKIFQFQHETKSPLDVCATQFLKIGTNTEDKIFSDKMFYSPGWLPAWCVAQTTFQLSLLPRSSKTRGKQQHTLVYAVLRIKHRASCKRGKHSTN